MTSSISPSLFGGVTILIFFTPAIFAGIPNINRVENNGADPPGIYKPTLFIALDSLQHLTPGDISIFACGLI